jgi:DNA-binding NarL/FixJ family response regulator
MDEIEPTFGVSANEQTPAIERITAAGDFHLANKSRKSDVSQGKQNGQRQPALKPDDNVVLSSVAQVSLLEEEGLSVAVIAVELGLTAEEVSTHVGIAGEIRHSSGSTSPLGDASPQTPPHKS